ALIDVNTPVGGVVADDVAKLAVIKTYLNIQSEAYGTVKDKAPLKNVPAGYYLCVDKGVVGDDGIETVGPGEAYSLYVVEVVGPTVIEPKKGTVESDKKVKDINDSVSTDYTDWEASADYDIGDAVPFQLSAKLPVDYANYETYKLTFHDTQSEGLTFDSSSVKVYVDGAEITEGFSVVAAKEATEAEPAVPGPGDGCTFEVQFADVKAISAAKAGSTITVEYTSTLNDKALVGSAGNGNTMHVEFSNNPNHSAAGDTDNTGTTPEDTVVVFTYKTVVNKVDEKGDALTGAGFTLYKKDAKGNYNVVGEEVTGTDLTTFEWKGLDDGDYKLVETTTPAGYNTMDPIEFKIVAETNGVISTNLTNVFTADVEAGSLTADIENTKGSILPSTGGMGTTILYLVGALLIIGAGTTLVMRRRRAEEN
ncbi:MAG: SpaH/EbpB family LPXTG-anchored major pilin, partial [Firmicutes bacterium]|nr:SpaH/EbpB family LPXTG-anchored major pilin [Bacillota bacterium]